MDDDISSNENDEPPGSGWMYPYPPEALQNVIPTPGSNLQKPKQTKLNKVSYPTIYQGSFPFTVDSCALKQACKSKSAGCVISRRSLYFRETFFPGASERDWNTIFVCFATKAFTNFQI